MLQEQTYNKCKYRESKKYCPQSSHELMVLRHQQPAKVLKGSQPQRMQSIPSDEVINNLCSACESFISK